MVKIFNPHAWLMAEVKPSTLQRMFPSAQATGTTTCVDDDFSVLVDRLTMEVESKQIDLTQGYENWRNIAFALAHTFGESGREYFHRISRMNPEYKREDCDKQYSNCLKCKGGGITIATLLWIAKTHGVIIKKMKYDY